MAQKVTKDVLIDKIAASTDCTKKTVRAVLDAFVDTMIQEFETAPLTEGHAKVPVYGLGNFNIRKREVSTARPPTAEEVAKGETMKARRANAATRFVRTVSFKPALPVKRALNS